MNDKWSSARLKWDQNRSGAFAKKVWKYFVPGLRKYSVGKVTPKIGKV